jgi:hypothetical protein
MRAERPGRDGDEARQRADLEECPVGYQRKFWKA